MQIHSGTDAAKRLGEYLLTLVAAGRAMQSLHLAMSELPGGDLPIWALSEALDAGTRLPRMAVFRIPGGDLFMFAEKFPLDALRQLRALVAGRVAAMEPDDISAVCHIYDLPDDAVALRRLVRSYLTGAPRPHRRAGGPAAGAVLAEPPPVAESGPEGPLTLDLLGQLQDLVDRIDIAPFIHRQPIWQKGSGWAVNYVEYFFDIARLRERYFPRLDLAANESLFIQFCRNLDDLMLVHLLTDKPAKQNRIGINLSITTIRSSIFKKFSDHLSAHERSNVVCELHWLEVLQDVQDGGAAVLELLESGYSLAFDRISVPILPYLDFSDSKFDYVKVRFDRQSIAQIQPESVTALRRCPPEKVVLTACDDRRAVALGEKLGIGNFQGRLLDEMMAMAA